MTRYQLELFNMLRNHLRTCIYM